ncbi:hypothetical protein VTL71DRAFT_11538 [Oculimacula yallundae]|uniref:BZIP domain-containing protein n=1 Tax=Oculimacula yallundae TaxID=86028 RepID=A0ABR4CQJ0_9HELO
MSESGVSSSSRRTESDVDMEEQRGSPAHSPPTPSINPRKGKGGRKVLFPTQEEKKQRNRDSQAAFRSRRKSHISELENIVQSQKDEIRASMREQASGKEEVLILKYKNSLLERILLEQGIDVNAELNNILVFPPRLPGKRARKERVPVPARPEPEVVQAEEVVAVTSQSPKTTSECCHCSSSRVKSSPAPHFSSSSTPLESVHAATTPQDMSRKRARQSTSIDTSDVRAHKRPRPVHQHRGQTRITGTNDPGKYSHHSPPASL